MQVTEDGKFEKECERVCETAKAHVDCSRPQLDKGSIKTNHRDKTRTCHLPQINQHHWLPDNNE